MKMLNKEKCEKAFKRLNGMIVTSPFEEDLIDYNDLKKYDTQLQNDFMDDVMVFMQLIEEHFNLQPYKFEDLKELIGKPIFDYKYKEFYILAEVKEEELYKDEGLEKIMICSDKKGLMRVYFEEGRFFPVTKGLEYQE